jgi:hypothetical protein
MLEFFHLASDAFHTLDCGRTLPLSLRKHLRTLQDKVKAYLPAVDTVGRAAPAELRRQEFSSLTGPRSSVHLL